MTTTPTHPSDAAQPFFAEMPAYVLMGVDRAGQRRVARERTASGLAVACFLSPVDALIEAERFRQMGLCYRVTTAVSLPQDTFKDADGRGLIADVHLGWPVLNRCLLTRPSGALGGYARVMHHWAREPLSFEFDEQVLAEVGRPHEWAGLFAWRETLDDMRAWSALRLMRVAQRALASIELTQIDATCYQVALFDPEAERWHFVPRREALSWQVQPRSFAGKSA